jgi:hypothetical protein
MLAITQEDTDMMRSMIRENIVNLINSVPVNPPPKSSKTFLTQFNEKEDEEKQEVNAIVNKKNLPHYDPKEDGIIKEGLELKLQRNILARYKADDQHAKKDLAVKRQEFEKRINVCKQKQSKLSEKQDEVFQQTLFEFFWS